MPFRLAEHHARGMADALERLGFKHAGEELRLQIPKRTFHGFDAARKAVEKTPVKKADMAALEQMFAAQAQAKQRHDGLHANALEEVFEHLDEPKTVGEQPSAKDLERTPSWGAPSNPAGGDAGSRTSDLGQPTGSGGI